VVPPAEQGRELDVFPIAGADVLVLQALGIVRSGWLVVDDDSVGHHLVMSADDGDLC
jgi:hypothetical protein